MASGGHRRQWPSGRHDRWRFELAEDIERLNREAEKGRYEITAISCAPVSDCPVALCIDGLWCLPWGGYGPVRFEGADDT